MKIQDSKLPEFFKERDIIEEMIEETRKDKVFCVDSIEEEIERTRKYKKMLNYKKEQIQKSKIQEIKVPERFKKIEDVIKKEDLKRFYYNLFFFGFLEYRDGIGYLLSDNTNFYLKIITYTDNFPIYDDFKEELYITENKAKEVLNYNILEEEMERQLMEETDMAQELYYSQFTEYYE